MSDAPPFRRVLVANRGEIAVRVCRGLRELGVGSVAIYSEPDRDAVHRFAADTACAIGGTTAAESYLRIEAVLDAARASGAEAIHPGYGFLSENPRFARAVEEAGLVFIGPSAASMCKLGSKAGARELAVACGVPVVPGFDGELPDDAAWLVKAREVGFPLLIKSSAGGGGKGMRLVERESEFLDALAAGRREAKAAFGDDRMLIERRVFPARHVEIQLFGDRHGDVVSLHERECSVQRRHQKVLEEAPSPAVDAKLRAKMGEAAVRLAKAAGYRGAGTAEFLLDERGGFYFLEVNTRLQVEHPVTECVIGLDLVHLQLHVAAGRRLEDLLAGRDLTPRGWAIEARIYAEAPEQGFLPAAGRLTRVIEAEGPGIRVDSGVREGSEVSVHYDPLLAKLVVHAPDRATACKRLAHALRESVYLGIPTNVDFLRRVVEDPRFARGELRTDFLDRAPELVTPTGDATPSAVFVAAALAAVLGDGHVAADGSNGGEARGAASMFATLGGFRVFGGES
ncbi:MAG: ATP-grasp domain-containing protein [Planctomycetes bacterium]|nr:ATP-grasp domain-containing protein [Planctomycetota bacterium]